MHRANSKVDGNNGSILFAVCVCVCVSFAATATDFGSETFLFLDPLDVCLLYVVSCKSTATDIFYLQSSISAMPHSENNMLICKERGTLG